MNSYTSISGVLIFDGKPVVTLVQRLLDSVQDKELQHRVAARIGRHASLCLEAA
jgi:hypothetical protein